MRDRGQRRLRPGIARVIQLLQVPDGVFVFDAGQRLANDGQRNVGLTSDQRQRGRDPGDLVRDREVVEPWWELGHFRR